LILVIQASVFRVTEMVSTTFDEREVHHAAAEYSEGHKESISFLLSKTWEGWHICRALVVFTVA
jgi:hypothetical protein